MIDLYYWPTPNGHKITLFLEEAGIPYTIKPVAIGKGEQFDIRCRLGRADHFGVGSTHVRTGWSETARPGAQRDVRCRP